MVFSQWVVHEYDGREELDKALQACDEEVRAYLFEGKHAEEPQISIDLDTEEMPKKKLSKKARLALEGMTITPEEGSTNTLNVTVGKDEDEF